MEDLLLNTKLATPLTRVGFLARPRLLERVESGLWRAEGFARKMTLICAPAGFGKTTLAAEWLRTGGHVYTWLSLDEHDNDPVRFLAYLLAAGRQVDGDFGSAVQQMLDSSQPPPSDVILTALINQLAAIPNPFILVLDDYQAIQLLPIHQQISLLLEYQPANLHLVIVTREDPPLPLANLRAQGQLLEIRQNELSFTMDEVTAFLVNVEKIELPPRDVAALARRTEGWAAGLQLAALSMHNSEDLPGFVRSFTGSNRYILDYLFEQVLIKQPDYIQDFLLRTAILDRFCAPLCDFVVETGEPRVQPLLFAHEILEYLEHANLFLIPLDDQREWYRYHSLFADLLRHRLRLEREIDASSLYLKASQWFEQGGYLSEAVTHALKSTEWTRAADLIMREYDGLLKRGQLTTLLNWFKQFPPGALQANPRLCLSYCWPLVLSGDPNQAEDLLVIAEGSGLDGPNVKGETAALRAFIARSRGDDTETIRASEIALAELPEREHSLRAVLAVNLLIAYWHNGQLLEMESALRESQEQAADTGNLYAQLTSQVFENRLLAARCQLHQAFLAYQPLVELGGEIPILALAYMDLGALYYEWNDFESSAEFLMKCIALSERTHNAEFQISGHAQMARLMLAGGDIGGALQQIRKSQQLLQEHTVTPINRARCAALQVQLTLAQGDLPGAVALAGEVGENADIHPFYPFVGLTPARLFLAQANRQAAQDYLTACYQRAYQAGWSYALLEIAVLRALATQHADDAMEILLPALQVGRKQGCIRVFADAGSGIVPLLHQAVLHGISPEYIGQILRALGEQPGTADQGEQALFEPLSERELQVMLLVAAGLSNRQIADQLVLSLGTVKTHIHHIYGKLDVRNRAQAIARVRELQLF